MNAPRAKSYGNERGCVHFNIWPAYRQLRLHKQEAVRTGEQAKLIKEGSLFACVQIKIGLLASRLYQVTGTRSGRSECQLSVWLARRYFKILTLSGQFIISTRATFCGGR